VGATLPPLSTLSLTVLSLPRFPSLPPMLAHPPTVPYATLLNRRKPQSLLAARASPENCVFGGKPKHQGAEPVKGAQHFRSAKASPLTDGDPDPWLTLRTQSSSEGCHPARDALTLRTFERRLLKTANARQSGYSNGLHSNSQQRHVVLRFHNGGAELAVLHDGTQICWIDLHNRPGNHRIVSRHLVECFA